MASTAFTLSELGDEVARELSRATRSFQAMQEESWQFLEEMDPVALTMVSPNWLEIGGMELQLRLDEIRHPWWRRLWSFVTHQPPPVGPLRFRLMPAGKESVTATLRFSKRSDGTYSWEESHAAVPG